MEQVFFNVPLSKLEPIFKRWVQEAQQELQEKSKKAQAPTETILTVEEASKFLNLSKPTIYSKVSRGELPVMKRGKRLYFSSSELIQYLKEGRKCTNDEIEQKAKKYLASK